MAKTTFVFLFILAIIAALLLGINLGKNLEKSQYQIPPTPTLTKISPTVPASPSPIASTSTVINGKYANKACGYEVTLPISWVKYEYDAKSVAFASSSASDSAKIAIICSLRIPTPAIAEINIEKYKLSTISALLFHDSSPKDGKPLDEIIAKVPGKNMDIFIAGFGPSLAQLLSTFKFLP